jgi:uncharacterized RDD family membrane protein YckC
MTDPTDPNVNQPGEGSVPPSGGYPPPPPPPQGTPPYGYGQQAPQASPAYGYGQPAPPPGAYFDQASGLMLPQGVELASIGRRIGAYFLAIPLAIVTLGIGYVIWGLVIWGRGQTPALQVLGMRCWRPDTGRVATFWWMALREIIGRLADGILSLLSLLVSFILMVTGRERKSLHDHIAGTVVLHDPNKILVA